MFQHETTTVYRIFPHMILINAIANQYVCVFQASIYQGKKFVCKQGYIIIVVIVEHYVLL